MEKTKKSGVLRDALILCVITVIAGVLVAFFYELTKTTIADNEAKATQAAYQSIFTDAAEFDTEPASVAGDASEVGAAAIADSGLDLGNVTVDGIVEAKDASGNSLGYIITTTSNDGYGGAIQISVGISADLTVKGVEILTINETAGLGMNAKEASFRDQYKDKAVEHFNLTKSDPTAEEDVQALSGATITSTAMTNAVNAAVVTARSILN